ncbi:MAG: P-II family nitrogen regulator [Butyrivibrio sp.]|nr:P-II family nitrogen regulator [Butyrivibrio sp.]
MKEVVMIVRPEKLEEIKKIIDDIGCGGMTLSTVMGCGTQKGASAEKGVNEIKGYKTTINLLPKIQIEIVVDDQYVEPIIMKIREACASEHVGDGKIFIRNIEEAVRIRTGERGSRAL